MSPRLLVVDDAPVMLLAYRNVLQPIAGEIDSAATLEEAQTLLQEHDYDVVITDLSLTKPAGQEGLAIIDVAHQQTPSPKTILVTGQGSPKVIARARSLGAHLCFEKPLDPRALVSAVAGILSDRPSSEDGRLPALPQGGRPTAPHPEGLSPQSDV